MDLFTKLFNKSLGGKKDMKQTSDIRGFFQYLSHAAVYANAYAPSAAFARRADNDLAEYGFGRDFIGFFSCYFKESCG